MGDGRDLFANVTSGIFNLDNLGGTTSSLFDLNELLAIDGFEDKRSKWTTYNFGGVNVPRTTHIISDTINKDYLNAWAAKLGSNYKNTMDTILDTGSLAHAYIEDFINFGKIKSSYKGFNNANQMQSMKAYQNFKNFWTDFHKRGYKIEPLITEMPFATPWYGGTMDFIANIVSPNGERKLFILDFKTSKKIGYSYFIQLILYFKAYIFLRNNNIPAFTCNFQKDPGPVDGIGIIRVDKELDKYEYILADSEHYYSFIMNLIDASDSMLNWYYNMNMIDSEYSNFRKYYIEGGGIDGIYR